MITSITSKNDYNVIIPLKYTCEYIYYESKVLDYVAKFALR
jgi:hypothetical protein